MGTDETRLQGLLQRSIRKVNAADANAAIAQMRAQEGTEDRPAVSYEVLLPAAEPLQYLTGSLLPRLVYFLDCAGFKLPRCAGVFISLFYGNDLFFIRAADALDELSQITGITPEEMVKAYGAGKFAC